MIPFGKEAQSSERLFLHLSGCHLIELNYAVCLIQTQRGGQVIGLDDREIHHYSEKWRRAFPMARLQSLLLYHTGKQTIPMSVVYDLFRQSYPWSPTSLGPDGKGKMYFQINTLFYSNTNPSSCNPQFAMVYRSLPTGEQDFHR